MPAKSAARRTRPRPSTSGPRRLVFRPGRRPPYRGPREKRERREKSDEERRRGTVEEGNRARARACDGSIAAVEIEITRLSTHPSYRDGRRFPLKVHQSREPIRFDRRRCRHHRQREICSPAAPLLLRCCRRRPAGSADGIISPVVMIIARHRAVSHRIAPSRPENWLFCITMTSLALSLSLSVPPAHLRVRSLSLSIRLSFPR